MRGDLVERRNRTWLGVRGVAVGSLVPVVAILLAACASPATPAVGQTPTTGTTAVATPMNAQSPSPLATSTPVLQAPQTIVDAAATASPVTAPTATPVPQAPQTIVGAAGTALPVNAPTATPIPTAIMPNTPPPTPALELMEQRQTGELANITFLVGDGSEATFTVREKLSILPLPNDAVVRTSAISGEIHLDGRPSVINIDLHQLSSDQSQRDRYVRNRMFPNDPIASFAVAELGQLPEGFTKGETVTGVVTGLLTLRGITVPLSFEVEARDDGDDLFVLGRTSFVWSDFEMRPPNIAGRIQVQDEVNVEVLLAVKPFLQPGN